ncbi:hypothetical protein ABZX95_16890 [Streptomyces sp. NPDC004232]|uniref:hypothetical protein n=1 Tax=Streptomyces sp. NPDC004232 TaxID=3154454 RepID=UPI0033A0EE74
MPTTPLSRGPVRSVTELNRLIRALWPHPEKRLSDAERAEYAALVEEWTVAVARKRRDEIVEAA